MSCKPHDLLALAKSLAELPSGMNDAATRNVISRAYYSSLHIVDASFEALASSKVKKGSSHRKIIDRAANYGENLEPDQPDRIVAGEIAKFTDKLRQTRNEADYKLELNIGVDKAADAIATAERIFSLCEEFQNRRIV